MEGRGKRGVEGRRERRKRGGVLHHWNVWPGPPAPPAGIFLSGLCPASSSAGSACSKGH